jgi:nucleoside-diphosphate-sugar epimerase
MKITIFGSTGATGQLVIEQALARNHEVIAYARQPDKLSICSEKLRVVKGQLTDDGAIDDCVAGADAVISVLGPAGRASGTPVADGTRRIVRAMVAHGVKRLVVTATPSAADPADLPPLSFRLAVVAVRLFAGSAYEDIVRTAEIVRASPLDWTVVRLPVLTNESALHPAVAGYLGDSRIKLFSLSRNALATFLIEQVSDDQWIRKAPALSNG